MRTSWPNYLNTKDVMSAVVNRTKYTIQNHLHCNKDFNNIDYISKGPFYKNILPFHFVLRYEVLNPY
jgi:hypothetical protein